MVVGGRTGSGKTKFLARPELQSWTLDLEAHARHRGSSFGGILNEQPSQATFENDVAFDVIRSREHPGFLVEAESRRIGRLNVPEDLFAAMQTAPMVILEVPFDERVAAIYIDYVDEPFAHFEQADPGRGAEHLRNFHLASLAKVHQHLGGELAQRLASLVTDSLPTGAANVSLETSRPWIETILREYYDPLYDRHEARYAPRVQARGTAPELAAATLEILTEMERDAGRGDA